MDTENIQNEIKELKKIMVKWSYTQKNRSEAWNLISEIEIFNHMFSSSFPSSVKYYKRNSRAEICMTDGIQELRIYSNSKLKIKDDVYFYDGLRNVNNALLNIIHELNEELDL